MTEFHHMVGERIALARKEVGMTQEDLAQRLGFKDRQILSHIESGKRKVSSDELIQFMNLLDKPVEYFTDPALVVAEGVMSWRAQTEPEDIKAFETWALGLMGAHRQLARQLKQPSSPLRMFLPLDKDSTYEAAMEAGEQLVQSWQIAPVPAPELQCKIEDELGVLVLPVDAPGTISGGAVNLPEGAAIFVNRNHARGRRHFTLAHELFHILTWHSMPPEKIDWERDNGPQKRPRVEKLADNFAGAVLMPLVALTKQLEEWRKKTTHPRAATASHVPPQSWFKTTAEYFQVSVMALKFRLITANLVLKEALEALELDFHEDAIPCRAFGRLLLDRLNQGIDRGFLSARKAAALLQTSVDDMATLFRSHDLEPSFSL